MELSIKARKFLLGAIEHKTLYIIIYTYIILVSGI